MIGPETEFGQASLYQPDKPGDRERAIAEAKRSFDRMREANGFPDALFTINEGELTPGWHYLYWYYNSHGATGAK